MKLNEKIPGLPKWPPIFYDGHKEEIIVKAKHVSYRRYLLGQVIWFFLVIGYPILTFWMACSKAPDGHELRVFIMMIIPYLIVMCFPMPRIICRLLFPRHTKVRFSPGYMIVNGKKYDVSAEVPVQFRASRPYLSQEEIEDLRARHKRNLTFRSEMHKLKFRRVEMIYGSRLIPVTSIAGDDLPDQFVIALQTGYEMAKSAKMKMPAKNIVSAPSMEDALPE